MLFFAFGISFSVLIGKAGTEPDEWELYEARLPSEAHFHKTQNGDPGAACKLEYLGDWSYYDDPLVSHFSPLVRTGGYLYE